MAAEGLVGRRAQTQPGLPEGQRVQRPGLMEQRQGWVGQQVLRVQARRQALG